jgi:hypothetical protein
VGVLSGVFGIGGGFIITPMLILLGVPPEIAAATGANQTVGTSVAGALAQWRRGNMDLRLGLVLIVGGAVGALLGVQLVKLLRQLGQIELFISLTYVLVLGVIGALMLAEGLRAIVRQRAGVPPPARKPGRHGFLLRLPLRMRFPRSKLYMSVLPPFALGVLVGVLSAVMGVGGGFLLVPAMIYLLRIQTRIVVGTSVLQVACITALTTVLHAAVNQTVDGLLALMLLLGGVVGAEIGVRAGSRLNAEQLRVGLAVLVLSISLRMAFDLTVTPSDLFTISHLP